MQYALVNNERHLPKPQLRGLCPACGRECLAKCGSKIAWHWAHHGKPHCDPWWENETDWHRNWKSLFPEKLREIVHFDNSTGEKHVADIKTERGLVIGRIKGARVTFIFASLHQVTRQATSSTTQLSDATHFASRCRTFPRRSSLIAPM